MPLGDQSVLPITLEPHPAISALWTSTGVLQPSNLPCIVKTGSIGTTNQNTKLSIQLPPGSAQDQSNCTSNTLKVTVTPASNISAQLNGPMMIYAVSGLPSFVTVTQPGTLPTAGGAITFVFNVSAIRALSAASHSTITISDPVATNQSTTLTLDVAPSASAQGFSQVASANPASSIEGSLIDFTITLSKPASRTEIVTWRMTTASCFTQAIAQAPYNAGSPSGFQFFQVPAGQSAAVIRVRSVAGGGGCVSRLHATPHIFEAWIGDQRVDPQVVVVSSGPTYTKTTINLLF
jgi:hypothetical protein